MKGNYKTIVFYFIITFLIISSFFIPKKDNGQIIPINYTIIENGVISGTIVRHERNDKGINLKVTFKDKYYNFMIDNSASIVVQDIDNKQRIELTAFNVANWLDNNSYATVMVGFYKGKVSDVIIHPLPK